MIKNNFPDYFIFELSSVCNFGCKMCYNSWKSGMKNPGKQLNFREQIKVLDIIGGLGKTVVFTGGEPTLNANIYELVEYAKKLGLKVILITNGSTIDFGKISLLKEKGVTTIQLSFHSWNEKAFNDITGTENFYNLIKTNIIDSLQIFGSDNVFINIVPNKFPFDGIMETCSNLFEIGIKNITVGIPVYSGSAKNNNILFSRKEIISLYDSLCYLNERLGINITLGTSLPQCLFYGKRLRNDLVKLSSGCSIGGNAVAIGFDGGIKPCVEFNKSIGNILKDSFENIWNCDELNRYRCNFYVPEICKGCKKLKKCRGGCRISAFHYSGTYDGRDPYM